MRFEHLDFEEAQARQYTSEDIPRNMVSLLLNQNKDQTDTRMLSDFANPALTGRYRITGHGQYLLPKPVSPDAREAFLYIQSFSWHHACKGDYTRRDSSATYLILYTYEGTGFLSYEGKEYTLKRGDGFFIDCRKPHEYRAVEETWEHSDLHFDGYTAHNLFSVFSDNGTVTFHEQTEGVYQDSLEHLLYHYDRIEPHRDLRIHSELTAMLTHLITKKEQTAAGSLAENIQYLAHYMQKHYAEPLTMDFLARFSGISKYYLSREFKRYTGFSPIDYLIHLRIEHAKFLLLQPDISVREAAERSGIGSEQYFSRLFRKRVGCTPGQYRARC